VVDLESLRRIPKQRLKELWIQGVLLGFLENRVGYMKLEHQVKNGRIDFYHKGNPPSAIELAVVMGNYIYQHRPKINSSEIKKLRSLTRPKKVRRFLLLVDLISKTPIERSRLKENYATYFRKSSSKITVIYVHKDDKFNFVL
jgi:hypothetical protein